MLVFSVFMSICGAIRGLALILVFGVLPWCDTPEVGIPFFRRLRGGRAAQPREALEGAGCESLRVPLVRM